MARIAFVTGGTGFLGQNLIERLLEGDWRVVALHRPTSDVSVLRRFPDERVTLAEGSIHDRASLERAIPEGADAVFHVAANTSMWRVKQDEQARDNVDGTRNVVEAAIARRARRLVHTSSIAAFGQGHTRPVTEETPSTADRSWIPYARTKWLADQEVRKGAARGGLETVILHPAGIIGRYDRHGWARVIALVWTGKLPGVPPGYGSFCHAAEVARAHVAAADRGRPGEGYLLGGADASFLELVQTVGRVLGRPVPTRTVPAWVLRTYARLAYWGSLVTRREPQVTPEGVELACRRQACVSAKAERELGYRPVPLAVMVEDCRRWMSEAGLLK